MEHRTLSLSGRLLTVGMSMLVLSIIISSFTNTVDGGLIVNSLCCDLGGSECAIDNPKITYLVRDIMGQYHLATSVRDLWHYDVDGDLLVTCSTTTNFTCDTYNSTSTNITYIGDYGFCDSFNCTTDGSAICVCSTNRGFYTQVGSYHETTLEWPVLYANCSLIVESHARRSLFSLDNSTLINVTREVVYIDATDDSIVLMFSSVAQRIITSQCRAKTNALLCNGSTCIISAWDVCISGEVVTLNMYNGPFVTQEFVLCPFRSVEDECKESGWIPMKALFTYKCMSAPIIVLWSFLFIYVAVIILRLLQSIAWIAYPLRWLGNWCHRGWMNCMKRNRQRRLSLTNAVAIIMILSGVGAQNTTSQPSLPFVSDGCSQSFQLTSSALSCTTNLNKRTCIVQTSLLGQLPFVGLTTCYTFSDDTSAVLMVKVTYVKHVTVGRLSLAYFTAPWTGWSASNKRCNSAGPCTSTTCPAINALPNAPNPDSQFSIYDDVTKYPGITTCEASCGCAGCGCGNCVDGCLYCRAVAKPVPGADVWWAYTITSLQQIPIIQLSVIDMTSGSYLLRFSQYDYGNGISFSTNTSSPLTGTFTTISQQPGASTVFGSKMVFADGDNALLVEGSAPGYPVAGTMGDIQSSTVAGLQTVGALNFNIAPNLWSHVSSQTQCLYTYAQSGLAGTLTNVLDPTSAIPGVGLPRLYNGDFWGYSKDGLVDSTPLPNGGGPILYGNILNPGAVAFGLSTTGNWTITRQVSVVCANNVKAISTGGCSSCSSGAYVNISVESSCSSGSAMITMFDNNNNDITLNVLTPAITLTASTAPQPKVFRIYFRTGLTAFSGSVCVNGSGKTSCVRFTASYSIDVTIRNSTVSAGNSTVYSGNTGLSIDVPSLDLGGGLFSWVTGLTSTSYFWYIVAGVIAAIILVVILGVVFLRRRSPKVKVKVSQPSISQKEQSDSGAFKRRNPRKQ